MSNEPVLAIGVDVGGTNTRCALIDVLSGTIRRRASHASHVGDYEGGVAALAAAVRGLADGAQVPVGVVIASQLDPSRQRAMVAPNLQWFDVPLVADLQRASGLAVVSMDNDVRGAALGELRYGALKGVEHPAACVFWGSGIGGALIANGRVQAGALALAGEAGHLVWRPGGEPCGCGKRGCYEAYFGGHALASRAGFDTTRALFAAASAGDSQAQAFVDEAVAAMGVHLATLVTFLDPQAIVMGGGIGLAQHQAVAHAAREHLLPVRRGALSVLPAVLGDDAGLLGAAAACFAM